MSSPPYDEHAEQIVAGALMLADPATIDETLAIVSPDDWWHGRHRTVAETVAALRRAGEPTDPVAVARRLTEHAQLADVGGHAGLSDLVGYAGSPATIGWHARTVADLARRRQVMQAAAGLAQAASDPGQPLDRTVADAVEAMSRAHRTSAVHDRDQLTDAALEELDRGDEMLGWPAPWQPLQRIWRLVPGWLHLLYGWPSAGKTALLDALIVELAERHGITTCLWSPEAASAARHKLLLAGVRAQTPPHELTTGDAVEALEWVGDHVDQLDAGVATRVDQIVAQASALRARGRADLLIIDPWTSVDMWDGGASGEGWDRMLQRQLRRLQQWARTHQAAVMLGAHPRQVEDNADRSPPRLKPSDLHGGAMYRNFTDSIAHIWRDHTDPTPAGSRAELHVQKVKEQGRGGQMGSMEELVRLESGRFAPLAYHHQEGVA